MLIRSHIDITGIALHVWIPLANARRYLLVADVEACKTLGRDQVGRSRHELSKGRSSKEKNSKKSHDSRRSKERENIVAGFCSSKREDLG